MTPLLQGYQKLTGLPSLPIPGCLWLPGFPGHSGDLYFPDFLGLPVFPELLGQPRFQGFQGVLTCQYYQRSQGSKDSLGYQGSLGFQGSY